MKLKINIFQNSFIVFLGIIVLLFIVFVVSDYGLIKKNELKNELDSLEKENKKLSQVFDSLSSVKNSLATDFFEVEKIAREKYGMLKPNEKIYKINKNSD